MKTTFFLSANRISNLLYCYINIFAEGTIVPTKSKGKLVMTVIEEFIHVHTMVRDETGKRINTTSGQLLTFWKENNLKDLRLSLEISMFHFNEQGTENDTTASAGAAASEEDFEAESSLIEQLKSMYTAEYNFSDLKLETKERTTSL